MPVTRPSWGAGRPYSAKEFSPKRWTGSSFSSCGRLMISMASKGHFSTQMPQDSPRQISSEMRTWSGLPSYSSPSSYVSPRLTMHSFARPVGRAEVHALVVTAVGLAPVQVHDRDAVVRHLRGKTPGGCPQDEPQREGHERDVDLVLRPEAVVFDPEHVQEGELDDDRDREDPDADLALRVTPGDRVGRDAGRDARHRGYRRDREPAHVRALIPSTVSVAMVVSRLRGTKSRPIRASAEKLDGNTPSS